MSHHKRTRCRSCDGEKLACFLDLGPTPLANSFLHSAKDFAQEQVYPLDVYFCESCSLVQLLDVVDPKVLFRDYIYTSGVSSTMAAHLRGLAQTVSEKSGLGAGDFVVEVGSNDGTLLKAFEPLGVRVLGVEPASNIAEIARERGVETVNCFFDSETASALRADYGPATVVMANNVLAHVDDTKDFLVGCRNLILDTGLVVIEVPYLRDLIERLEYDTIYHEHLCYFSVGALVNLFANVGLSLVQIDRVSIHGGSLRLYARPSEADLGHSEQVMSMVEEEANLDMNVRTGYEHFADRVHENREALRTLLLELKGSGHKLAAYGAPAKGNTLLNYCGIDSDLIPYTVDKSPLKQGLLTPGTHIPVRSPTTLLEDQPDYLLILAWNFAEEIMSQQEEYRRAGGQFILPVPNPEVV